MRQQLGDVSALGRPARMGRGDEGAGVPGRGAAGHPRKGSQPPRPVSSMSRSCRDSGLGHVDPSGGDEGAGVPGRGAARVLDPPMEDRNAEFKCSNKSLQVVMKGLGFPAVERLVYSTCSVYDEETERLVQARAARARARAARGRRGGSGGA